MLLIHFVHFIIYRVLKKAKPLFLHNFTMYLSASAVAV